MDRGHRHSLDEAAHLPYLTYVNPHPSFTGFICLSDDARMNEYFDVRLLKRSLGATRRDRSIRTLYGDKAWVEDLDIVNELGAHTGCVNALRYSTVFLSLSFTASARKVLLIPSLAVGPQVATSSLRARMTLISTSGATIHPEVQHPSRLTRA